MTISQKISACLIVRNEAHNIRRCLDSVVPHVDEIVIVDTGSTDNTVEICKGYGATIYHSPWRDDFSYHRNESIDHASCEWILRIDADEELIVDPGVDVRGQLASVPINVNMTRNTMEDIIDGQVSMTFMQHHFLRREKVYFKNRKHNMPVFVGGIYTLKGIKTRHYGYSAEQIAGKKERDLKLLLKMQSDNPDDYQVLYWLAQTYGYYLNKPKKALPLLKKYIRIAHDKQNFQPSAYITAAETANALGKKNDARRFLADAFNRYPDDIDVNFLRVSFGVDDADAAAIEDGCNRYLFAYERLKANPAGADSRFTWFFSDEKLTYILHKLTIMHLSKGLEYSRLFDQYLQRIDAGIRSELAGCMQSDLVKIGVGTAGQTDKAA